MGTRWAAKLLLPCSSFSLTFPSWLDTQLPEHSCPYPAHSPHRQGFSACTTLPHEPAAFVGFLGGSVGQPDGAEAILTSGALHKAQKPQPVQPSENSEETPTGRVTAAQRAQGLPGKRQG